MISPRAAVFLAGLLIAPDAATAGAFLGVAMTDPPPDFVDARGKPARGAYVAKVLIPSPAAEAGIQTGDVIVRFGKEPIDSFLELSDRVAASKVDEVVQIWVLRPPRSKKVTVKVKLGNVDDYLKEEAPVVQKSSPRYTRLSLGDTAPDFSAVDLEGVPLRLSDYRGKWVFLDFWAVWCGPCIVEIPYLLEAHMKFSKYPIEFLSVSLDESRDQVVQFTKDHELPFRQIFSGRIWDDPVSRLYGVRAIPVNFLIDPQGQIAAVGLRRAAVLEHLSTIFGEPLE